MLKKQSITKEHGKRRQYDVEFKSSAVQMVLNGRSVVDVSRSLGINENLLRQWKAAHESQQPLSARTEVEELKRYIRQLELEREVVKKALPIFSRTT